MKARKQTNNLSPASKQQGAAAAEASEVQQLGRRQEASWAL
jgi:hypothetical protein